MITKEISKLYKDTKNKSRTILKLLNYKIKDKVNFLIN